MLESTENFLAKNAFDCFNIPMSRPVILENSLG